MPDLVLVGAGEVRIHLGHGGRRLGPAFVIGRTPPLSASRVLLADMAGSGSPGLVWSMAPTANGRAGYLYLDLLGGTKPYLLAGIDNGRGLRTTITYTTSAAERARDLADGRRWVGYLPFPVHVVASVTTADTVTGQSATTRYCYHDGQYDGHTRQWLGFAEVEATDLATDHEDPDLQRMWFHNQVASAGVPAFEAGRGQPHRTEVVDPATGALRMLSTSIWSALPVDPAVPDAGAWLAVETERTSTRYADDATVYARERLGFEHDACGNVVVETRRGEWSDDEGAHVDELRIDRAFAAHTVHGITSLRARERRTSGGRLLKGFDWHYDGPAFEGLPLGQVERGFLLRQTEIALTPAMRADAYGGSVPAEIDDLYRLETDHDLGPIHVHDTRRYRLDAFGNQLETKDSLGRHVIIAYDADGLTPVSSTEAGHPVRMVAFDPVVQQATAIEDSNGHVLRARFDGLGEIVAVWRRTGADAPTEEYERIRDTVPQRVVQRIRLLSDDLTPGWERHTHLDGAGNAVQEHTRADTGWAVERAEIRSVRGRPVTTFAAYDAASPDFAAPPPGTVRHDTFYDFAGRNVRETLFGGAEIRHIHVGAETRFYDPDATAALAVDPTTPPSRTMVHCH